MKLKILSAVLILSIPQVMAQRNGADEIKTSKGILKINPVMHASFVLNWDSKTIYVDPTGSPEMYKSFGAPDIIVITDIHGDHMDLKALEAFNSSTSGCCDAAPAFIQGEINNIKQRHANQSDGYYD